MPPALETSARDAAVLEKDQPQLADTHGGGPGDPGPKGRGGGGGGDEGGGGDPRYVPGAGLLAMRLAMVSVAMLFVTVGLAYSARAATHKNWQHIHVPRLLWISTAVILVSGWLLEIARGRVHGRDRAGAMAWLAATLGAGFAFLACQLLALRALMGQGILMRGNPHGSLFYVITGAHALHLAGGIAAVAYLLTVVFRRPALRPPATPQPQLAKLDSRVGVTALYWHFLTVLWLGLFIALLAWP